MNPRVQGLLAAAALMQYAAIDMSRQGKLGAVVDALEGGRERSLREALKPRPVPTKNSPEIEAWNKAVEERKAAKRAAKKGNP